MQKEIFFDEMTLNEVTERLRLIDAAERTKREHVAVVNAIALTLARWSGCAPTDVVRLNAGGTGVLFGPAQNDDPMMLYSSDEERLGNKTPGEGVVVDEPSFAKASAGKK